MNKSDFLKNSIVLEFINWIEPKLSEGTNFKHSYVLNKTKINWECTNLYNAYLNYSWNDVDFNKNSFTLSKLKDSINHGISEGNQLQTKQACIDILTWGHVTQHNKQWIDIQSDIVGYLKNVSLALNNNTFNTNSLNSTIRLNAGFTKIYSLIIDDFIIYDSRVSAAICLLIKRFLLETNRLEVPDILKFHFETGKMGAPRNPNENKYLFPRIYNSNANHQISNIKANWLLKGILDNTSSKFNVLAVDSQMRALESSLFMIGYKIK